MSNQGFCESCYTRKPVRWVLVDESMECEMCKPCREGLKTHCSVKLIKM